MFFFSFLVPLAPAGIKCIPSGPSSVMVAWKAPHRSHGPLVHYAVYYRVKGDSSPSSRTLQVTVSFGHILVRVSNSDE